MQNQEMKNNNKINNKSINNNGNIKDNGSNIEENYINGGGDNFNGNNKKYLEFEKTVKMDWDITKNHIIKNKENNENKKKN